MFDSIRNHKKFFMGILLVLIIPSFVLVGVEGYSRFNEGGSEVASVNGRGIKQVEWDQAHQEESQRLRQAMPQIDPKLLDSPEARYATLERLVRERVLAAAAQKDNLYTSDTRLARDLQQNETIATFRKPDGTLDVEGYRQLLARQGLTPETFENSVRADLSQRQVVGGVTASAIAPLAIAKPSVNAFFEQREVRVLAVPAASFAARVKPTDADIEAFYNANGALFQAPEQVDIEYLVLDAAALEKSVVINEADLKAYYEQNAARLSGAEERRARHILLSVAPNASPADKEAVKQKAQALLEQLRREPQRFADIARAESQDPGSAANGGDLDFFGRGAMVKPFEDVVFSLKKDAISDLVETEFGFHIIQLTDIKAPPVRSFAELRPQLEADLRKQQAQRQFAEAADVFSNTVYEQADSLQPAADKLKLTVQTAQALPRSGGAGVLGNPRLLEALFANESITSKRNIAAVETASSQLVSARVVQHLPARTLPLAEVREAVTQRLIASRAAELAREEGEKQRTAWQGGQVPAGATPVQTLSRASARSLPPALVQAALSADPAKLPAIIGVPLGDQGYAVVEIAKVLPAVERPADLAKEDAREYARAWSDAEARAFYEELKTRFKVKIKVPRPQGAAAIGG